MREFCRDFLLFVLELNYRDVISGVTATILQSTDDERYRSPEEVKLRDGEHNWGLVAFFSLLLSCLKPALPLLFLHIHMGHFVQVSTQSHLLGEAFPCCSVESSNGSNDNSNNSGNS